MDIYSLEFTDNEGNTIEGPYLFADPEDAKKSVQMTWPKDIFYFKSDDFRNIWISAPGNESFGVIRHSGKLHSKPVRLHNGFGFPG